MEKILYFISLLLLNYVCVSKTFAQDPPPPPAPAIEYNEKAWKKFSSDSGQFSILVPGTLTETTSMVGSGRQAEFHLFHLKTGGFEYVVTYVDLALNTDNAGVIDKILDESKDSSMKAMQASVISETKISIDGHSGREVEAEVSGRVLRYRSYLIGARLYTMGITTRKPPAELKPIIEFHESVRSKFLGSFTPLKQVKTNEGQNPESRSSSTVQNTPSQTTNASEQPVHLKLPVSEGVLQETARKKVRPTYPAEAKSQKLAGEVGVKILVSEEGQVIEAKAVSGPAPLHASAIEAARQWEFKPTLFDGRKVRLEGVLMFKFKP